MRVKSAPDFSNWGETVDMASSALQFKLVTSLGRLAAKLDEFAEGSAESPFQ